MEELLTKSEDLRKVRAALLNVLEDTDELRRSAVDERNKTMAIIENLTDGVILLNKKKQIEIINSPATELFNIGKKEAELLAIEAGAEDILWEEDNLIIYTKPEEMENVKNNLMSLKVDFANLEWVAKEKISADEEKCTSFIEAIEDHDDVSNVYTNIL
jgi:transcriptional/translational regulatory protein YebC/TACO1